MKRNIKLVNSSKNNIFIKHINNKYKPLYIKPFYFKFIDKIIHYTSDFKEWNNNIYYFNSNYIKNLPVYDINVNKLLKFYFDLNLNLKIIRRKLTKLKKKKLSLNKIFISKAELKHTSSKAIITIYTFNRERIILWKKLFKLIKRILIIKGKREKIKLKRKSKKLIHRRSDDKRRLLRIKRLVLLQRLKIIKLKFDINNLKFKDILIYKLSKLLSKFYKKKVEFNIINLKSLEFNSNIFTGILKKKLINRNARILKLLNFILKKVNKDKFAINLNTFDNKNEKKNINIKSIVENVNLNEAIKNYYNIENHSNIKFIQDSIKYKDIGGIKLALKGRLTRRYRADKSLYKIKIKGILRKKPIFNVNEKFPNIYRGNIKSNLDYSIGIDKRRIGAFAVKGWVSGK